MGQRTVLAQGKARTIGTGKSAQYKVRELTNGQTCATIRIAGSNRVNMRVGTAKEVMAWVGLHVEVEEEF